MKCYIIELIEKNPIGVRSDATRAIICDNENKINELVNAFNQSHRNKIEYKIIKIYSIIDNEIKSLLDIF